MKFDLRAIIFFALLLAGCGFQAPQPKITPPVATPTAPTSTLDAELRLPASEIAKLLNDKTQNQIARLDGKRVKCPLGKCELDLLATRNGPITVNLQGDRLALSLPFNINARIRLKMPLMKTSGEGQGTGLATATSAFSITPDWELHSKTQGTIEFSHADLQIGPASAELSDFLNDESDEIAHPLFKEIDSQLPKWANLQKRVAQLWAKAAMPIPVGKNPSVFLLLSPQRVFVSPPHVEGNALVVALGLVIQARAVVGDRPNVAFIPPLPAPEPMRGKPESRFHLLVPAILPYSEAVRLASYQIAKHPISIGNSTAVKISDLQILPSRDDVVVAARFCISPSWDPFGWFDACGQGYLRGVPVFDTATGVLRITKIVYDTDTLSALVGQWSGLAGPDFISELEKRFTFDLSGQITKLKDQVAKALAKGTGSDLSVSGQMESFGAPELSWTKDGFIASFTAEGAVKTAFQP